MKRDRKIDYTLISHIQSVLNSGGFINVDVIDAYPEKSIQNLPAVSVQIINNEPEYTELGSRKTKCDYLFAIDVLGRTDGERSDITDLIYRESNKLQLTTVNTTGWSSQNLIANPNFDSLDNWNLGNAGTNNVSYYCSPIEGDCVYWNTCPFGPRDIDSPAWYLCDEFKANGNYSLGLFVEESLHTVSATGTDISLTAGTYMVSGQMWKELNYTNAMNIHVMSGEAAIASTDDFSDSESQQTGSRIWIEQTKEFNILTSQIVNIKLSTILKRAASIQNDTGTPCLDHTHAAWDALGLFAQEVTIGGEKIFIGSRRKVVFGQRYGRYEATISLEVFDNICEG